MTNRRLAAVIGTAALVNLTAQFYGWPGWLVVALTVAAGAGVFFMLEART